MRFKKFMGKTPTVDHKERKITEYNNEYNNKTTNKKTIKK